MKIVISCACLVDLRLRSPSICDNHFMGQCELLLKEIDVTNEIAVQS